MRRVALVLLAAGCGTNPHSGGIGELIRPPADSVEVSPFHPILATGEGQLGLTRDTGEVVSVSRIADDRGTWLIPDEPLAFGATYVLTADDRETFRFFHTADPALRRVGSTAEAFDRLDATRAAADSEAYAPPDPTELARFRTALDRMLDGDWDVDEALAEVGYAWAATEDAGRWRLLVWESPATTHRGAFAFAFDATTGLVVQAPHPEYDSDTGVQAVDAFAALDAGALFVAGSHRCANAEDSPCDGTTSACGSTGPYKVSDAAHDDQSFFQVAHEATLAAWSDSVSLQLHGFAWDGSEPAAYASDGTSADDADSVSRIVRDALAQALPGYAFASCNDAGDVSRLCGTTNTQGRASNGSPDSCDTGASAASGQFVHLEQARVLRTDERAAVLGALGVLQAPPPDLF